MNIKNVLVPVDFSPPSRLAVDHAVSLAREFQGRLTLLHVVESVPAFADSFRIETAGIQKEQEEQALRMLSALLGAEDQDDLDLRVVIKSGDIKGEICEAIREAKADIVVMGTHGRGLFGRLFIGSITEGILRKVSIPVLTICHVVQPREFKRILFATDLSGGSEQAFDFALEFARTVHSDLVILHAIHNMGSAYEGVETLADVNEYSVDEAKARLATFRAGADRSKIKAETIVVEDVPADAILKAADEQVPDLILIAVQKKGLVERALLGTTAERVVREAKVPVLCVPVGVATGQEQVATTESGKSALKASMTQSKLAQ